MPSDSERRQEFNTTLIIAIIVAAILALGVLGMIYGCMKANHAPQVKPVAGNRPITLGYERHAAFSQWEQIRESMGNPDGNPRC